MDTQSINKINIDYRLSDYVNEKLTDDEYFARLDIDMVFHPNDAQIIVDLLIKKIKNEKLPRNLVKLGNIYEIDPEKLAVDGYWQVKGDDENVEYNGETVGFLRFFNSTRENLVTVKRPLGLCMNLERLILCPRNTALKVEPSWTTNGFCVGSGTIREAIIMRKMISIHQLE